MQVISFVERALRRSTPRPSGLREPPPLSGGLPLIGHTIEFVSSTIDLLRRASREHGEISALSIAGKRMVAFFGPEANEAIFRAPDETLSPAEAYQIMTPVFGEGIVYDATPERMAEQMKMLLPALKDRRMRTYGETVVAEVEQAISGWGESGTVEFVDFCRVLTNFTSASCLLGKEFRHGMSDEFARVYHDLERGVTPIAYINAHLPLPSFRRRDRARVRMVEMIGRIIADRRRDKREGEDFLQTLMDSRYADGSGLTENEITGMLLAAMFAGHHTSSVTTAWTLIELLRTPDYKARVVGQIDRLFGEGQEITHAALRELTLTEYAVKEALRLHPPLFMLVRVAKTDWQYKDYFIPKGTWCLVSPTVSHEIAEVFRDPLRFDPDRFAPPREEDKRDFAYIAFGGGRHKCLGNAFAILQVKTILALLLERYEFELTGDPIASDFHGLVIGPKEPCRVRYRLRQKAAKAVTPAAHTEDGRRPKSEAQAAGGAAATSDAGAAETSATQCPFHAESAPTARRIAITLDRDLCQGHAVCAAEAPEVFQLGGDGKVSLVGTDRPEPALHAQVMKAAKFCPTRAIRVVEE